jgi:hypothetical protein
LAEEAALVEEVDLAEVVCQVALEVFSNKEEQEEQEAQEDEEPRVTVKEEEENKIHSAFSSSNNLGL